MQGYLLDLASGPGEVYAVGAYNFEAEGAVLSFGAVSGSSNWAKSYIPNDDSDLVFEAGAVNSNGDLIVCGNINEGNTIALVQIGSNGSVIASYKVNTINPLLTWCNDLWITADGGISFHIRFTLNRVFDICIKSWRFSFRCIEIDIYSIASMVRILEFCRFLYYSNG